MGQLQKKLTRILVFAALAMALAFAGMLVPATAHAATFTAGPFSVSGGTKGKDYSFSDKTHILTIKTAEPLAIRTPRLNQSTTATIAVKKNVSANITLNGVNIKSASKPAFQIADNSKGNVKITLTAGWTNTLQSGSEHAGLEKNGTKKVGTLTITGAGTLVANGGECAAGIGSGYEKSTSNIHIEGGVIEANGGVDAAGIGGAGGGSASNISISGGVVRASSGIGGAAIGSGYQYSNGSKVTYSNIAISGGTVTAEVLGSGTYRGAGIGGGYDVSPGDPVKITGGSIKVIGNDGFKAFDTNPVNASGNPLQLLKVPNPDSKAVRIDGPVWTASNHAAGILKDSETKDTNLYAYVTKDDHAVRIDDQLFYYKYEDGEFVLSAVVPTTDSKTDDAQVATGADSEDTDAVTATKAFAKASFSSNAITVKWNRVKGAEGYDIYLAKCGSKGKLVQEKYRAKTVKGFAGGTATFKKVNGAELVTAKAYKAKVRAYKMVNGKKQYLSSSPAMHFVSTKNAKYTNASKVTASASKVALKAGKSKKVTAKVTKAQTSKKLLSTSHVAKVRWYSADKTVATMSKSGTITAKKSGTCTVYAVAANGTKAKVKVTVS